MEVHWIILLCIVGIICIACEVYLPGGFIGTVGAGIFIWSVVEAYRKSPEFGSMMLVCGLGGAISCSWFSFKYLTKTKEGRKALLMDAEIKLPEDRHKGLEGKVGEAITDLRPSGVIMLEGERVEVATQGEYLVKGTKVKVFKIEADFVYVNEHTEKDTEEA